MTKTELKNASVYTLKCYLKTKLYAKEKNLVRKLIKRKKAKNIKDRNIFINSKLYKLTVAECLRKGKCEIVKVWGVKIIYPYPFSNYKFWKTMLSILREAQKRELMETLKTDNYDVPCIQI